METIHFNSLPIETQDEITDSMSCEMWDNYFYNPKTGKWAAYDADHINSKPAPWLKIIWD